MEGGHCLPTFAESIAMNSITRNELVNGNHIIEIAGDHKEFIFLIILSSIIACFFVFKGFATGDSILYAYGIEDIWEHGLKEIPNNFNGEIAFGYYLLLSALFSVFNYIFTLSAIMNYVNALSSIVMIGFFFFFIISLGFNKRIALFTYLAVLISPEIWLLSHYGHPGMLSLMFFMGSLLLLTHIDLNYLAKSPQTTKLLLFIICSYLALIMRLDILLSFGAYLGILYYKNKFNKLNILRFLMVLLVTLSLVLLSRYYVLGYFITPTEGTFAYHLGHKLYGAYFPREIIKNLVYWLLGISPFIAVIALIGIGSFGLRSPRTVLFFAWVMDLPRLAAPTILVFSLMAIAFLEEKFSATAKPALAMTLALVMAQIISIGLYYPLQAVYPFRLKFEGRSLTSVPLGFLLTDHYSRQQLTLARQNVAEQIARDRDGNILIVDLASSTCYYDYYIRKHRDIVELTGNKIKTKENAFYFIIPDNDLSINHPISRFLHSSDVSADKIHVTPFAGEYPVDQRKLYLEKNELAPLLQYEVSMMDMRRKVISK
jgi:hypothetical protein